jgi:hypothetical protein
MVILLIYHVKAHSKNTPESRRLGVKKGGTIPSEAGRDLRLSREVLRLD